MRKSFLSVNSWKLNRIDGILWLFVDSKNLLKVRNDGSTLHIVIEIFILILFPDLTHLSVDTSHNINRTMKVYALYIDIFAEKCRPIPRIAMLLTCAR